MTTLSEDTRFNLSPKNFFTIVVFVAGFVGMYYSLQAKELPEPSQVPTEQMIQIQKELTFIKTEMLEMKETLNRLDDRIYQLKTN